MARPVVRVEHPERVTVYADPRTRVWGGTGFRRVPDGYRSQVRVVVRARSVSALLRAHNAQVEGVPLSRHVFSEWWAETGNALELAATAAVPEDTVLWRPLDAPPELRGTLVPWDHDWPEAPAHES